ncbi:hypothetical protein HYQ46_003625 [Verticillium longisporum]|nr:hypothetical protein HYQ46_003625 [Verticillium longisporum]
MIFSTSPRSLCSDLVLLLALTHVEDINVRLCLPREKVDDELRPESWSGGLLARRTAEVDRRSLRNGSPAVAGPGRLLLSPDGDIGRLGRSCQADGLALLCSVEGRCVARHAVRAEGLGMSVIEALDGNRLVVASGHVVTVF